MYKSYHLSNVFPIDAKFIYAKYLNKLSLIQHEISILSILQVQTSNLVFHEAK